MFKLSKKTIEMMWRNFDVPINDNEEIDEDWCGWERFTPREDIWRWFDEQYAMFGGVHALMYPQEHANDKPGQSANGEVPAHVNFQIWVRDYAVEIGSADFDCSLALDALPLDFVKRIESGIADYDTDDVYYEAARIGLVMEHYGPFSCYVDDDDKLNAYIAKREERIRL